MLTTKKRESQRLWRQSATTLLSIFRGLDLFLIMSAWPVQYLMKVSKFLVLWIYDDCHLVLFPIKTVLDFQRSIQRFEGHHVPCGYDVVIPI